MIAKQKEFQVGLHLVSKSRSNDIPTSLPNCLKEYIFGKSGAQNQSDKPKDSFSDLMIDLGLGKKAAEPMPQPMSNNQNNMGMNNNPNNMGMNNKPNNIEDKFSSFELSTSS